MKYDIEAFRSARIDPDRVWSFEATARRIAARLAIMAAGEALAWEQWAEDQRNEAAKRSKETTP